MRFIIAGLFSLVCVPMASADIILAFDAADLSVMSNGANQQFNVDLLATHSGPEPNTLSGFTLDIADPGFGLTISNPASSPFAWSLGGPTVTFFGDVYSIGAAGFTNNTLTANGTTTLATVTFNLDSSVTSQVFPLDLTIRDAARDLFTDISSEFSATDSNFTVMNAGAAAVPEPSTYGMLLAGSMIFGASRLRERKKAKVSV